MNKNLILTLCMGNIFDKMAEITHPRFIQYANNINADFKVISESTNSTMAWEKCQIYDLLNNYDRILYIDTDIVIRKDSPNLFEIVPSECFGAWSESNGCLLEIHNTAMNTIFEKYNVTPIDWKHNYFNSGVMVVSKTHKDLFIAPEVKHDYFYEQTYFNMRLAQLNYKFFNLSTKFNQWSGPLETVEQIITRDAYFYHFYGRCGHDNIQDLLKAVATKLDNYENSY